MRIEVTVTLDLDETDGMTTYHISRLGAPGLSGADYSSMQRGEMIADIGHDLVSMLPKSMPIKGGK